MNNYGATDSVWNSHHVAEPSVGGGAYDADPTLPVLRGHQVRYTAMYESDGRVAGYNLFLPAHTDINHAIALAAKELPSDAQTIWQTKLATKNGTCYQADFVSPTLGSVLSDDHQGQVAVVLEHQDPGSSANPLEQSPDLSVITDVVFAEDPGTTAADANGC